MMQVGYDGAVRAISRQMVIGGTDGLARDSDDYQQDLVLVIPKLQSTFRDRYGYSSKAEHRYVTKSLWNVARGMRRRAQFQTALIADVDPDTESQESDGRLEARICLRKLEERLSSSDVSLLLRIGLSGGRLREAWCPENDGSYATFCRRIQRLRQRARLVIDG